MKRLCLLLAFSLGTLCIYAQNLTQAEYFIDTDPGVGAGVNVPFTAATSITNLQVSVPVTALGNGLHAIFFRVKDANNVWSTTERTYFYKAVIPTITETPTPAAANITKAEYFIDTDPGAGLGTNIPITSGLTIADVTIPVPVSSLTEGLHQILVRVMNASGVWSTTERTYFYKLAIPTITETPTPAAVNLTKAEYFIDTDPGIGLATNIPITPGLAVSDVVLQVPVTSLTEGLHQILVRVQNANGVWSTTERTYFYKKTIPTITGTPTPAAVNITKAEYFIDTDPGIGAGTNITITAGTTITDLITPVSVSSLSEGTHKLYLRVRNANLVWSTTEVASFSVCNGNVPVAAAASAVTTSGFTANWATTTSALSYELDVSADNFVTFVSGYNAKVINAPVTSVAVTGLNQATTYKYRVRGYRTCASVSSSVITVGIPVATPASQPTNMVFLAPGPTDINVSFTPPATLPGGYLVVRRAGAYSTFVPANNTSYSKDQPVGDGIVAYADAPPLLGDVGLTPNTNYYYTVYAYNQLNGFISYQTTAPLKGNSFTLAAEPVAQPTALQFSNVTSTSYKVSFSAATGNPYGYIVLRKAGSEPASVPVDGTAYTTAVGSDAIAYQGSALTFNETNLADNTTYHYAIYAYNGSQTSINYNTLSPLRGSQLTPLTPSAAATNLQFSNITTSAITGSYTAPVPAPAGYVVVRNQGSATSFVPQLNTPYSLGSVTGGTIIYVGTNTTFTDSGLTPSTVYYYTVFSFNQNGTLISYQTVPPLQGSVSTFTAEPTAQATSLSFTTITTTSMTLTFAAAVPPPSGYLVLRKPGSAPTVLPVDGIAYTAGNMLSDNATVVVFSGSATSVPNTALLPGTTYFFQVFSYNGAGSATNYLTTVSGSNSGSAITVPDKPIANDASQVGQTQFTANWNATTGAASCRLDVSSENFVTMHSGFGDRLVNSTSITVTGLNPGTTYQYRVRAVNASGTSINSDPISQITVPATPTFSNPSLIEQTKFTANWNAVTGATEYIIEVSATNDFSTLVTGYPSNLPGNLTTKSIEGLPPGLTYYYRIRSKNAGGTSPYSTTGSQLLRPATPIGSDATNTTSTGFKAKWQSATGATEYRLDVSLASTDFNPSLSSYTNSLITGGVLEFFVTGLESNTAYKYRIRAVNASGDSPSSSPVSVSTLDVASSGPLTQPIPGLSTGGTLESYRMFSIPWELQNGNTKTEDIFSSMGTQADDKWKLLRWNSAGNTWDRYPKQLLTIDRGKSYWFNSLNQLPENVTGSPYADASFALVLQPGWNQIGSPYVKNLSWTDILAINSTVPNVSMVETDLYRFDPSVPTYTKTDNLKAWSGNFVFNKGSQITLNIPSTTKVSTGGRLSSNFESDISLNNWMVSFALTVDGMECSNSSIGMHPDAQPGIDSFDGMTVPRFIQYLELNSPHPEFFEPNFSSDIVPTTSSNNWHFVAETNLDREYAVLSWNHQSLGSNEAKLILFDPANGALIDMKEVGHYQFKLAGGKHPLHFLYAKDAESLKPDVTSLVEVYPNPVSTVVTFPFLTSSHDFVKLEIWDLTGKKIRTVIDREFPAGLQKVQWDVTDDQGARVASGLYIYRFIGTGNVVQTGKLIIR